MRVDCFDNTMFWRGEIVIIVIHDCLYDTLVS